MESYDRDRLGEYIKVEREREQKNIPGHQEFVLGGVNLKVSSHKTILPQQLSLIFRASKSLELEDLEITWGKRVLRLSEIMEEPPTIFLALDSKRVSAAHFGPIANEDYPNGCVVVNHLSSPRDVLVLFHELGHNNVWQSSEKQEKYKVQNLVSKLKSGELDYRTAGLVLKSERDAWAFALKKLRPFLSVQGSEDGMTSVTEARHFIHDLMLSSYTQELERGLYEQEKKEIEATVGEVLEEMQSISV